MFYVYILTNKNNTVLYIGVTKDLSSRLYDHRESLQKGFTKQYNASKLIYFEEFPDPVNAIAREKQLKGWSRKKKEELINRVNPQWNDLLNVV